MRCKIPSFFWQWKIKARHTLHSMPSQQLPNLPPPQSCPSFLHCFPDVNLRSRKIVEYRVCLNTKMCWKIIKCVVLNTIWSLYIKTFLPCDLSRSTKRYLPFAKLITQINMHPKIKSRNCFMVRYKIDREKKCSGR